MATKPQFGSLSAEGPDEQSLADEIKGSYAKLREALDARQNQMFDPVLLAMAQGFLSPTKTGSFGEALGNVASMVGPAQESQDKRMRENAMMKMELAQQELSQRQATRGEAAFQGLLGKMSGSSGIKEPIGAPVPGDAFMPSRDPAALVDQATQGSRSVTSADIARLKAMPGMAEKGKILEDMIKNDRDRFTISMNGIVFDRDTQKYMNLEIPGQKQEPFDTNFGTYNMTPNEYSQYKQANSLGQGEQWIKNFRGASSAGDSPSAGGTPGAVGRLTVQEQAAKNRAAEVKATKTAESETARTQNIFNQAKDVTARMAQYATLRSITARPDSKEIFGIMNRPDFGSFVTGLVQAGIKSPGQTSIQVSALEDKLRNLAIPQDQIDRYRFALSTMANIQLQTAKLAEGQGSVSESERELFANASISPQDNPATILAKLSMLEARAEFDKKTASALRKSKLEADDFVDTPDYQNMVNEYLLRVSNIASGIGSQTPAKQGQKSSSGQKTAPGSYSAARQKLNKELGLD